MIRIYKGDLFEIINTISIDTIINAANGIGPMGRGIAGAIKKHGGDEIQKDAFNICRELNPKAGEAYKTISGKLSVIGVKQIIHAVTMKKPGDKTTYEIIGKAFISALNLAIKKKASVIGCTALGTGVGRLNSYKVANIMYEIADKYNKIIDIVFIDIDKIFIDRLLELKEIKNGV